MTVYHSNIKLLLLSSVFITYKWTASIEKIPFVKDSVHSWSLLCSYPAHWSAMLALAVHPSAVPLGFAADLSLIVHHSMLLLKIQLSALPQSCFEGLDSSISFPSPAGPALTILMWSARDRCGDLKQYVRSRYLCKSPLQPLQPLLPPRCSPLSNCCSGPLVWKKRMMSVTGHPLLVSRLFCSSSKHWHLVWL